MLTKENFKKVLSLPCVVMENPKMIFFRIPKNASTTIHRGYLQPNYTTLNERTNKRGFLEWREKVSFDWFQAAFKFTFARNPWDRFVSLYVYFTTYTPKKKGAPLADRWVGPIPSFKEFVMDFEKICETRPDIKNHATFQSLFAFDEGEQYVDFIGRFENLREDFETVKAKIGLTAPYELDHLMKTEHDHYSAFYSEESRKKINEMYKQDIYNFGYRFYQSKLVARAEYP